MGKITVIGNDQRREYELGAITTIGRHPDNTMQILDRGRISNKMYRKQPPSSAMKG